MANKFDQLRAMATAILAYSESTEESRAKWGDDVKNLLQELSIYHVELEQQNAALLQAEQELTESREQYIDLFENAPVGYVIIDDDQVIHQANRTFIEQFIPLALQNDTVNGRSFGERIASEYRIVFDQYCRMLAQSQPSIPLEIKLLNCMDEPLWIQITAGRRNPGTRQFRLAINDIHSRKLMEIQLLQAKTAAEEEAKKKTLFLSDVSHELKTPLATISGFCELLIDSHLDNETAMKYLASIQDAANIMGTVTDEALDMAKLSSGKFTLNTSKTDINKICDVQILLEQKRIQEKGVTILNELDDIPLLIADPGRIGTVIHSILKHALGNATHGAIHIRGNYLEKNEKKGILTLEFSGDHIFSGERKNISASYDAISVNCDGIGLFVAGRMLKPMDGQMFRPHPHNSLRIEIPLLRAEDVTIQKIATSAESSGVKRCLLVDDVLLNLKVLAALMRKVDYLPVMASSGKEALRLLSQGTYDLIMTDLWMPEMNGVEFAISVRQMREYSNIPIIAVTADVERASNFDMRYFADTLIKPVGLNMIKEKMALWKADDMDECKQ